MIPREVTRLFRENMCGIEGEPMLQGTMGNRRIYVFKLSRPMCLGRVPRVIEENGKFRIASFDEWNEIQLAIASGKFDS